jgi:hypothetical protein
LKPNRPFVFEGVNLTNDDEIRPLGHNAMAHALKAVKPGYTPPWLALFFPRLGWRRDRIPARAC